jgi:hypothetical protein
MPEFSDIFLSFYKPTSSRYFNQFPVPAWKELTSHLPLAHTGMLDFSSSHYSHGSRCFYIGRGVCPLLPLKFLFVDKNGQ